MKRRPDRYDYGFSALGVMLSYLFLVFTKEQGWSSLMSITALVIVSVPTGLALGWSKTRLQKKRRNVR